MYLKLSMGKIGKTFTLLLTLIIAMSCLTLLNVNPANAQTIPKPSVPEFTVEVRDSSYDVPPTTTTRTDLDGRLITSTSPGYHVSSGNVVLTIINQPFTSYYDKDGYPINLYYHIRIKGEESADWATGGYIKANSTTIDKVTLSYSGYYFFETNQGGFGILGYSAWRLNEPLSFQVEAFIGHTKTNSLPMNPLFPYDLKDVEYIGQTSGWSNTQTITIPTGSVSNVTPEPTAQTTSTPTTASTSTSTSTAPDINSNSITLPLAAFIAITVAVVLLAVALSVLLLMRHRKTVNLKQ